MGHSIIKIKPEINFNRFQGIRWIILFLTGALFYAHSIDAQVVNIGDTIAITDGTKLHIGGSFGNLSDSIYRPYILNNGIIEVDGDFTGSIGMIYYGNDTFIATGYGNQQIAGITYHTFIVNSGGEKKLSGNSAIKNRLIILQGTFNTLTDTVFLDSGAILIEDSVNYLKGKIKIEKYIGPNQTFSFGNIGLDINSGIKAPCHVAALRATGPGSIQSANGNSSIARFFDISPFNNSGLGADIVFHYYGNELNGIASKDLELFRSEDTGLHWMYVGDDMRNNPNRTVLKSGIDSFSRWTLGSKLKPLPVEMLSFDVYLQSLESAKLIWITASEINNNHFDIERSENGKNFIKVGEVQGNGTTNHIINYDYMDVFGTSTGAILYYRLKQVDYNDHYQYSQIRKVMLSSTHEKFKAWYNGYTDKMEAIVYYERETKANIRMIDIQGKLVAEQNVTLNKGASHIQIDMLGLAEGMYTLYLVDAEGIEVKRLMKN